MLKSFEQKLQRFSQRDKDLARIPRSVQQTIPIQAVSKDGIFHVGESRFSKCFAFSDINYAVASEENKTALLEQYCKVIDNLELGASSKITVIARKASRSEYESRILLPLQNDALDEYREELNQMLLEKAGSQENLTLERFVTVTLERRTLQDARVAFSRIESNLSVGFARLDSKLETLDAQRRLESLCRFYHPGEEVEFHLDFDANKPLQQDFKDSFAPDGMEVHSDHFRIGESYGRVLFVRDWTTSISDDILMKLCTGKRNLCVSVDLKPVPTHLAMKEIDKRMMAVEGKINKWQEKQNKNQNYSAATPYHLALQRREVNEMYEDVNERDQRMLVGTVTLVHTADTLAQLNLDTEALMQEGQLNLTLGTLRYQQLEGLATALPIGVNKLQITRALTTETAAFHVPFRVQEIMERGGLYYGENAISRNLILLNRRNKQNPNTFVLGVPGSGKSFAVKMQLVLSALLYPQDDIIIADPEGEYSALIRALGGEVIDISAGSQNHINAMDIVEGYSVDNANDPAKDKAEFILKLFEIIEKSGTIGGAEHSIIDRCVREVYREMKTEMPTLSTLREKLLEQPEPEAHSLALTLELFTLGSLNIFAHKTNVNTKNRIISYNIKDLGEQLRPLGLLVITDSLFNRVAENWNKGKCTHIIIDEAHVVLSNEHSAEFFELAWRRFRKRDGFPTAITQNAHVLMNSDHGTSMLANSEIIVMLNQAPEDQEQLGRLLNISPEQMKYVSNADEGCGLIRYAGTLAPFINRFPKDTKLYKLMDTKPKKKDPEQGAEDDGQV